MGSALGSVTSHRRAVLSLDAVASQRPSGLKATSTTDFDRQRRFAGEDIDAVGVDEVVRAMTNTSSVGIK